MVFKLIILGFIIFFGYSCARSGDNYQNILRPVKVVNVESLRAVDRKYTGIVVADEFSNLSFKVSGPLIEMNVIAGQRIKKGTVIAAIDPLDYQSKYEADFAAYVSAEARLARDEKLLEMQAVSEQDYEISRANYIKMKSAWKISKNNLEYVRLVAPFDGFVEKKYVENYQKVQSGENVIKLVNPDKLSVRFILPETSVGLTKMPMKITVGFDIYPEFEFHAQIQDIVDASPDGAGIPIKLTIDDELFNKDKYTVYPGFSAQVHLRVDDNVVGEYMIPLSAVFDDLVTNEISVWIYHTDTGTVSRRKIEIKHLYGQDKVVIAGGLRAEDVIVVEGVNFITEGQKVNNLVTHYSLQTTNE